MITKLLVGVCASLTTAIGMMVFVIHPSNERIAEHEAAYLIILAQTWKELTPERRPYFQIELEENHDVLITEASANDYFSLSSETLLGRALEHRLGNRAQIQEETDDRIRVVVDGVELQMLRGHPRFSENS